MRKSFLPLVGSLADGSVARNGLLGHWPTTRGKALRKTCLSLPISVLSPPMIQRYTIGELVHNIKTDEVGRVKELLLDTSSETRYRVVVPKDPAFIAVDDETHEAVWHESDLIPSSHKA
jgi:hypothetical protein